MSPGDILAVASGLLALAGFGYMLLRDRGTDTSEADRRLEAITNRLSQLETKVDVFWRGVSFDAARVLHSPHPEHARRDHLLEAFEQQQLTAAESAELESMMTAVLDDLTGEPGQRMAASVILRYLRWQLEAAGA